MSTPKQLLRLDAIVIAEVVKRLRAERAASVTVEKDGEPVYVFDANGRGHLLSTEFGELVDEVVE